MSNCEVREVASRIDAKKRETKLSKPFVSFVCFVGRKEKTQSRNDESDINH
jgi:hypothetical protein